MVTYLHQNWQNFDVKTFQNQPYYFTQLVFRSLTRLETVLKWLFILLLLLVFLLNHFFPPILEYD
jgi:hypothetical protein